MAFAASGTWTNTGGGNYSDGGNWLGGTVADGATATANLNTLDISGEVVVTLDSSRTIGNLTFGDTNTGSAGVWTVMEGTPGNKFTLDNGGSSPQITVNQLGVTPEGYDDVFVDVGLGGSNGFTKLGNGILRLDGSWNDITGNVNVNAGTLRLGSGFLYSTDGVTPIAQTISQFNLANGATLEAAGTAGNPAVSNVSVAAGGTATLNSTGGNIYAANVTAPGTGETLNVNFTNTSTMSPAGSWAGFATVNATGLNEAGVSFLRLMPNNTGGQPAFNTNSFANTQVNLNKVQMLVRTNSGGNDINIGALSGTASAELSGGGGVTGGTVARYHIGALNTNTAFAGRVLTGLGILLDKTGSGSLTLSGSLEYTTTNNATADRRGGVTRITGGTLALTGTSAIPGGIVDGTLGNLYTTIDIRSGATFDVSGASSTYSTADLQQVIGAGTIQGNYNHDEGRLMPGDVPVGNSNNTTPTAGTLTFDDNLSFNGGRIAYDMSLNPASGNDLIQVGGTTTLTGGATVSPNFLAGVPTSGTYTVVSSTGGFVGTPAAWSLSWPGRGAPPPLFVSGNNLQFTAIPPSGNDLNWTGISSSNWDVQVTQNWYNNDTSAADRFYTGDDVVFEDAYGPSDTPVTNFAVTLVGDVYPMSVTVDSTASYGIAGTGRIVGNGSFTKRGPSTLTMQTANTFTGPATIEAGTVNIGAATGALGSGLLTMSGGSLLAANTANAALTNSGLAAATGTSSTITVNGNAANPLALPGLSGDGDLAIRTEVTGKIVDLGASATFTGNLTIGADGVLATGMVARFNGSTSGLAGAAVTLVNGASLRDRATSAQTIALGSLTGDGTTLVGGFQGGSSSPQLKTWEIGALGTSTTFAGTITNASCVSGGITYYSATAITKVGAGTLTLTGNNNYAGVTTVNGGTLLVNGTHVSDTSTEPDFTVGDYVVNSGGTLGGTGTIGDGVDPVLITVNNGGTLAPGMSIGTLAVRGNVAFAAGSIFGVEVNASTSTSDLLAILGSLDLSGSPTLDVSLLAGTTPTGPHTIATYTGTLLGTFAATPGIVVDYGTGANSQIRITVNEIISGLIGDYNEDNVVDAADYTVWRDNFGGDGSLLPNRDPANSGPIGEPDWVSWKTHFGETSPGSGSLASLGAVPEPSTALLACAALLGAMLVAGRRRR